MSCRITVLVRQHPNGGVPVIGERTREEYYEAFTKAIKEKASTLSVKDEEGDLFVFVPSEIQGFVIEQL